MKRSSKITQKIRANFWLRGLFWGTIFGVVAGLHFLAFAAFMNIFTLDSHQNQKRTEIYLERTRGLVETFYLSASPRRFPDSLDELAEGPTPIVIHVPRDVWGRPFVYLKTSGMGFVVYSLGPDGVDHTTDDVRLYE